MTLISHIDRKKQAIFNRQKSKEPIQCVGDVILNKILLYFTNRNMIVINIKTM